MNPTNEFQSPFEGSLPSAIHSGDLRETIA